MDSSKTYYAERMSARNASDLVERHSTLGVESYQGVSTLVVSRHCLHLGINQAALALGAHDDAVLRNVSSAASTTENRKHLGPLEVLQINFLGPLLGRLDSGLAASYVRHIPGTVKGGALT
jgi:hypothetical protein